MLRTNLSTRPFYNIRAVQALLGAFAALVILMTMFNVISLLRLATSQRSLGARAVQAQTEATRLRADAARVRSQVDAKELEVVSVAAREANSIIDMRAFSWSELLAHFETTLPENVRITAVQPRVDRDGFSIGIRVEARQSCGPREVPGRPGDDRRVSQRAGDRRTGDIRRVARGGHRREVRTADARRGWRETGGGHNGATRSCR